MSNDLNFGGEQAEADPLIDDAFYESAIYRQINSKTDRHCFLIGRTGSGKSAVLRHIEEGHAEHTIRINPEDLSLPYLLDLGVVRRLDSLDVHMDPFFIALWKHVLVVELIRHHYRVTSPAEKRTRLQTLRERIARDPNKKQALEYVEEFGEKFWSATGEGVREIVETLEKSIDAGGKAAATVVPKVLGASGEVSSSRSSKTEVRREVTEYYQKIVNDSQLPKLNKMIEVINDDVLHSAQDFTYVIIDDLDRDWIDESLANDLIRCLFRAVLDLQRVRQLKVVVALRTNIFEHLNFGSKTGGQEEKFRSLSCVVKWSERELRELAEDRAEAAALASSWAGARTLTGILPARSKKRGDPFSFLLKYTLLRPRDLIAFMNECLSTAGGGSRLTWKDLDAALHPYSQKRLLALRDEWKPTFPDIDKVFRKFNEKSQVLTLDEMTEILDDVALLLAEREFSGTVWLSKISEPLWSGSVTDSWFASYGGLVRLLYDIGFIGIAERGKPFRYSQTAPSLSELSSVYSDTTRFRVHDAFAAALNL